MPYSVNRLPKQKQMLMTGIYLLLAGVAAFGFLPLAIILYKQKRVKKLLATGHQATARVYRVYKPVRSATNIVYYQFTTLGGSTATGSLTTKMGMYKTGDLLKVYYSPNAPQRSTVEGAWQSKVLLAFGALVALGVLLMVYKLWEVIRSQGM